MGHCGEIFHLGYALILLNFSCRVRFQFIVMMNTKCILHSAPIRTRTEITRPLWWGDMNSRKWIPTLTTKQLFTGRQTDEGKESPSLETAIKISKEWTCASTPNSSLTLRPFLCILMTELKLPLVFDMYSRFPTGKKLKAWPHSSKDVLTLCPR